MADRIAELTGTFLTPGVSKNKRLYTAEHAAAATARMQARLADPNGRPITMLTHHGAGDDSTAIAARVTRVWLDESNTAWWSADVADTEAGRTIAALVTPERPYLRNVSLRGWWLGEPRTVMVDGQPVETADGIEVDGIDFTKNPGVDGARIATAALAETRTVITESVEARLMPDTVETVYADPGYRPDGAKRLPLTTAAEIRTAWNTETTGYTPKQVKRIRGRIREAARTHGFDVAAESTAVTAAVTEALEEAWASMRVDSGPGEVAVSGYTNDPALLAAVGKRVAAAALVALTALDPDNDGDIDLDPEDTDADETTVTAAAVTETASTKEAAVAESTETTAAPTPPKPVEQMTESELREWAVTLQTAKPATESVEKPAEKPAETTEAVKTETEGTETTETLTKADVAAIVAEAVKALTPEPEKPAETTETEKSVDERIAEAVAAAKAEVIEATGKTIARAGIRRGLVEKAPVEADKPLHEMDADELHAHGAKVWS